jgi:hypothetical protein
MPHAPHAAIEAIKVGRALAGGPMAFASKDLGLHGTDDALRDCALRQMAKAGLHSPSFSV